MSETLSLAESLTLTGKKFGRPAQKATSTALNQMVSTKRKSDAKLRLLWILLFKLNGRLVLNTAELPSTALYSRALEALKLNRINHSAILTSTDARATASDLRAAAVWLLHPIGEKDDLLIETPDGATDSASRGEASEDQFWDECDHLMTSKGKKPPRNRHGAYSTSVRGSIGNLNVPNGFGQPKGMGQIGYASGTD